MIRTTFAMLCSGLLSLFLASRMNWLGEEYALVMMATDAGAAAVVLIYPAGRAQSIIGLTFLLQLGVYLSRLIHGSNFDATAYWWLLSLLAFLQLFVAVGWWANERLDWRRLVPGRREAAGATHRSGMDG